jgi:hypothetical protein
LFKHGLMFPGKCGDTPSWSRLGVSCNSGIQIFVPSPGMNYQSQLLHRSKKIHKFKKLTNIPLYLKRPTVMFK